MFELIRHAHNLRPEHNGCVATIGNFDGVHRGHQAVLAGLRDKAAALGLPAVVMSFEPLPREVLARGEVPARISGLREKVAQMKLYGVDRLLLVRFDEAFRAQSPEAFIDRWLVHGLGVRHLVVGDDFRFGHRAAGDFALLCEAGEQLGFAVESTRTYRAGTERISSTRIRAHLAAGELDAVEHLLGREFAWRGRVVHGDALGRTLGFPTANLKPGRKVLPLQGVFAVEVEEDGEPLRRGVCNVGYRPSVDGRQPRVEVHVLDTRRDYYGHHLRLVFRHRLRGEQRFDSLDALKAQITRDIAAARAWFDGAR